jgi:hypothetical protein
MAIISETYFAVDELDWDYTGQLSSSLLPDLSLI